MTVQTVNFIICFSCSTFPDCNFSRNPTTCYLDHENPIVFQHGWGTLSKSCVSGIGDLCTLRLRVDYHILVHWWLLSYTDQSSVSSVLFSYRILFLLSLLLREILHTVCLQESFSKISLAQDFFVWQHSLIPLEVFRKLTTFWLLELFFFFLKCGILHFSDQYVIISTTMIFKFYLPFLFWCDVLTFTH